MAEGVGGAVRLAGRLIDRRAPLLRSLAAPLAGAAAGLGLVALGMPQLGMPQSCMTRAPVIDSISLFALVATAPAVAGYWLLRER
jgi:hypothetical protein